MPAPDRTRAGYRVYSQEHVKRLHFVRRGRELGFGLDKLRGLLRLVDGDAYTCAEVHALTIGHLKDIRRKIADLKRLEKVMASMAAQCTDDQVPDCPVIDALTCGKSILIERPVARPARFGGRAYFALEMMGWTAPRTASACQDRRCRNPICQIDRNGWRGMSRARSVMDASLEAPLLLALSSFDKTRDEVVER
jgi:MerR family mercuric resistance operon transcriptional regulator